MFDLDIRTLDNGFFSYPALSVSPTGLTLYRLSVNEEGETRLKQKGIKPPENNIEKGFLSRKGKKSLVNAVHWFLYSVDKELILSGKGKKKIGFLTLTLQSKQVHSDKEIKAKCLNQFLTEIRSDYGVTKYIWKAEKQDNGHLHFHLLTDTFLPVLEVREKWNRIIGKLGYVRLYAERMRKLTFDDYCKLRWNEKRIKNMARVEKMKLLKKAFKKGQSEKWRNPNSIDLESLKKVKHVGAYIGKYMSKEHKKGKLTGEEKHALSVEGRLWYSSLSISKLKNLQIDALEPEFAEISDILNVVKNSKDIYQTDYTLSINTPVDSLWNYGFEKIPKRFFDYANDLFNGFEKSDFDNEKPDKKPSEIPKKKKEIKQVKIDFFEDLPKVKSLEDYH